MPPSSPRDFFAKHFGREFTSQPWVSRIAIVACVATFLGLAIQDDYDSTARFGYLSGPEIWEGAVWGLVTSAFVHFALWHLAFNVYWLWVLGTRLEEAIGSPRFLAFFIMSAFVSSSLELALGDDTGIGASGVVYAMFGFMWIARDRYPSFIEILADRTILIFVVWLVGCIAATYLEIVNIGNAAHVSGLMFGASVAAAFVLPKNRRLMQAAMIALVALSVVPLVWCPWSVSWLETKAYAAHDAEKYELALERYTHIIEVDPRNAWAYNNRSGVHAQLGDFEMASLDLRRAGELDPEYRH